MRRRWSRDGVGDRPRSPARPSVWTEPGSGGRGAHDRSLAAWRGEGGSPHPLWRATGRSSGSFLAKRCRSVVLLAGITRSLWSVPTSYHEAFTAFHRGIVRFPAFVAMFGVAALQGTTPTGRSPAAPPHRPYCRSRRVFPSNRLKAASIFACWCVRYRKITKRSTGVRLSLRRPSAVRRISPSPTRSATPARSDRLVSTILVTPPPRPFSTADSRDKPARRRFRGRGRRTCCRRSGCRRRGRQRRRGRGPGPRRSQRPPRPGRPRRRRGGRDLACPARPR